MKHNFRRPDSLSGIARTAALLMLVLLPAFMPARAQEKAAVPAPPAPATAQEDPVLRAMLTELARSTSRLKLENASAPYYVEYRVTDLDQYDAEALFGSLRFETRQKLRVLRAVVRVGDYHRDSYFRQGLGMVDILCLD